MNTRKLLLYVTAFASLLGAAFAQTRPTEATVIKLTGSATVTLPNGTTTPVVQGQKIPQGATITTGADGDVLLQAHATTAATIKANSTVSVDELSVSTSGGKVTEEKTTLNLKSGNLVSALDPSKKSVNNYQVRTVKGVAAARGTTFSVTINGAVYSITTTSGGVSFTSPSGATFTVGAGQTTDGAGSAPTNIADMPEGPAKAAAVAEMTNVLAAVAVAVTANVVPASELQTAVTAAVNAAPASATTIAQTVAAVAPAVTETVISAVNASNAPAETMSAAISAAQTAASTSTSTTTTTKTQPGQTTKTPITTPQPIDVTVTSRSG